MHFLFRHLPGVQLDAHAFGQLLPGPLEGDQLRGDDVGPFPAVVGLAPDEDDGILDQQRGVLVERIGEQDDLDLALQVFEDEDRHLGAGVAAGLGQVVPDLGDHPADGDLLFASPLRLPVALAVA